MPSANKQNKHKQKKTRPFFNHRIKLHKIWLWEKVCYTSTAYIYLDVHREKQTRFNPLKTKIISQPNHPENWTWCNTCKSGSKSKILFLVFPLLDYTGLEVYGIYSTFQIILVQVWWWFLFLPWTWLSTQMGLAPVRAYLTIQGQCAQNLRYSYRTLVPYNDLNTTMYMSICMITTVWITQI